MIRSLLKHQWLAFRRSSSFGRELGISILVAIIAVFITGSIVLIAFLLPQILIKLAGEENALSLLNSMVGYYLLLEFIFRYLLQKVPAIDIEPYLTLPVKRRKIALFLIGRSLFSLFNLYPVILVLPLAIKLVRPEYGVLGSIAWTISFLMLSLSVHFFQILFKKKYDENPYIWMIIAAIAALSYAMRYWWGTDLMRPFGQFMEAIGSTPVLTIVPFMIAAFSIFITFRFFKENLYVEELVPERNREPGFFSTTNFLYRTAASDQLLLQELRLLFRHKRTRSLAILSLVFIPYGLIFFGNEDYENTKAVYVFIGIFVSGIFTINYGQFFWGWNTNQLDFYFTRPIPLKLWVRSRHRLLIYSALISLILCTPYVYFGWDILLLLACCCLFNIGINIPIMMRLSMWTPKPIDLNKGSIMNYQGTGAAQWIMAIPILASPYLVYIPVSQLFGFIPAVLAIGAVGGIGFIFRDYFLNQMIGHLQKMKYKLIRDLIL